LILYTYGAWILIPFFKVLINEEGIFVNRPLFKIIKYMRGGFNIKWNEFTHIHSPYLPLWFPLKFIVANADKHPFKYSIALGTGYTHFKESLIFIANHVPAGIIDDDVKQLIDKYRKDINNKSL